MRRIEVTDEELALIRQALEDAAFYRDARSRVLDRAVRKRDRSSTPAGSDHQEKAKAYLDLARRLRQAQDA